MNGFCLQDTSPRALSHSRAPCRQPLATLPVPCRSVKAESNMEQCHQARAGSAVCLADIANLLLSDLDGSVDPFMVQSDSQPQDSVADTFPLATGDLESFQDISGYCQNSTVQVLDLAREMRMSCSVPEDELITPDIGCKGEFNFNQVPELDTNTHLRDEWGLSSVYGTDLLDTWLSLSSDGKDMIQEVPGNTAEPAYMMEPVIKDEDLGLSVACEEVVSGVSSAVETIIPNMVSEDCVAPGVPVAEDTDSIARTENMLSLLNEREVCDQSFPLNIERTVAVDSERPSSILNEVASSRNKKRPGLKLNLDLLLGDTGSISTPEVLQPLVEGGNGGFDLLTYLFDNDRVKGQAVNVDYPKVKPDIGADIPSKTADVKKTANFQVLKTEPTTTEQKEVTVTRPVLRSAKGRKITSRVPEAPSVTLEPVVGRPVQEIKKTAAQKIAVGKPRQLYRIKEEPVELVPSPVSEEKEVATKGKKLVTLRTLEKIPLPPTPKVIVETNPTKLIVRSAQPIQTEQNHITLKTNTSKRKKRISIDSISSTRSKRSRRSTSSSVEEIEGDAPWECHRYRELRDRNNEASRRSRLNRKVREEEQLEQAAQLERENQTLRIRAEEMERLVERLRQALIDAVVKSRKSQ